MADDEATTTEPPLPTSGSAAVLGVIRQGTSPGKYEVVIIREGFARGDMDGGPFIVEGRPLYWTKQGIESGVEVYAGAAVTAFRLGDEFSHLPEDLDALKVKAALNEVGRLSNVRVEQAADGLHELRATLTLHEGVPALVASVLQAWTDESIPLAHRGGFSIDARAEFLPGLIGGKAVTQGVRILPNANGSSVDLVSHPAAGGQVIRKIAASIRSAAPKESQMAEPASKQDAPVAADAAEVARIKQEAQDALKGLAASKAELDAAAKAMRIERTEMKVQQAVVASKLPESAGSLVAESFAGAEKFDAEAVAAKIAKVTQALGLDKPVVSGSGIEVGMDVQEKKELALEALLVPSHAPENVKQGLKVRLKAAGLTAPKPSFVALAKDFGVDFLGGYQGTAAEKRKIKQSLNTAALGDAFENVLNRLVIAYSENPDFADWRKVARIGSFRDITTKQERIALGGYGNLATVSESANYPALTSFGDQGHGYTPLKKGGTEDLTWEAILRDDVNALANIPMKLGTAAARTLYEYAFDFFTYAGMPTMDYDSNALYYARTLTNTQAGSYAMADTYLQIALLQIRKQADLTSAKRLGLTARNGFLLHPVELEDTAHTLLKPLSEFAPGESTNQSYLRTYGLNPITVRHWANTTDYAIVCNPSEFPSLEIGFLNGNQSPELFVQDNQNLGSMFDADKITWKIRHIFGGTVVRHEGVAGVDSSA